MIAGIDHVKSDALVIIDADLQDPPELIQEMISYWEDGYSDVYARRNNRQGETWLKKKPANGITEYCKNQPTSPFRSTLEIFACWIADVLKLYKNSANLSAIQKQFSAGLAIRKKRYFIIAIPDWLVKPSGITGNYSTWQLTELLVLLPHRYAWQLFLDSSFRSLLLSGLFIF